MNNQHKIYTIYAGVNGAGKSTLYESSKIKLDGERINSDDILIADGGDWKNKKDQKRM